MFIAVWLDLLSSQWDFIVWCGDKSKRGIAWNHPAKIPVFCQAMPLKNHKEACTCMLGKKYNGCTSKNKSIDKKLRTTLHMYLLRDTSKLIFSSLSPFLPRFEYRKFYIKKNFNINSATLDPCSSLYRARSSSCTSAIFICKWSTIFCEVVDEVVLFYRMSY